MALEVNESLPTVRCRRDIVSLVGEHGAQGFGNIVIVIDEQNGSGDVSIDRHTCS